MIPTLSIIIATYAIARLLQIPIEHSNHQQKLLLLVVISILGIAIIAISTADILNAGISASDLLNLGR